MPHALGHIVAYTHLRRTVGRVTGVGRFIAAAPRKLAENGWDVRVLTARDQFDPSSTLVELPVTVLPCRSRRLEWGGALCGTPRLDRLVAGADWVWHPAESYVAVRSVPTAVTAHTGDWLEPDLPWAGELRYRRLRLRWSLLYRQLRKIRARVLAVSAFLKDRLVARQGVRDADIDVVGHGVDNAYFAAMGQTLPEVVRAVEPYVFIASGLSYYKGGDRALAVAERLPNVRFVAAGDDPPARPVPPNVKRIGYVPTESGLPDWYAGATATLVLSRYETFGLPVAEAQAAGSPVFVASAGALPEVAGHEDCVVPADRPDEVADRIRQLMRSPGERVAMVMRGRERVEEFRWSKTAARITAALKRQAS